MDLGLAGKRAVVTGASKGIGLTVARTLAAEGVYIVAGSRETSEELKELVASGQASDVQVDLASDSGPSHLIQVALDGGPIDILINNAGAVTPRIGGSGSVTDEQWSFSLNLTLMAAVRTARAALPPMIEAGRGSIVNTASVNASLPGPARYRLQRRKGGTRELLEITFKRSRATRGTSQHRKSRACSHRLMARQPRRRIHTLKHFRRKPHRLPTKRGTRHRHPQVHQARRSSRPDRLSSQRPKRQHHRCRLHHRRRPNPKPLNPTRRTRQLVLGAPLPNKGSDSDAQKRDA